MLCENFEGNIDASPCDCLILGLHEDWSNSTVPSEINRISDGLLKKLIETDEISTKPLKCTTVLAPHGLPAKILVTVGLGARDSAHPSIYFRAASAAVKTIANRPRKNVRLVGFGGSMLQMRGAVAGSWVGCQGQDVMRKERVLFEPEKIEWHGLEPEIVRQGSIIGQSMNATRRWINLPANVMDPVSLANEAKELAARDGFEFESWDRDKLTQERCGALLGVARGSSRPPRLVILKYRGNDSAAPTVLVGKGVTFDSGGYSIKPTDGMLSMKCDMAGAATVMGIMSAAARLKVSHNLIGVLGLVENMISGDAFRLGDVLTARSGKTIEIHNTDAEGRLVLADCLNVALDFSPQRIVDFATLTGACVVALGSEISGLMTNHEAWQREIKQVADECGEYTWPLPMHSFFAEQISGKVADIKNVGEGRYAGAITAAKFLEEFVDHKPWTHIDIAGPAYLDSPKAWCDAGGTGTLVRSFVELFMRE
jgi:leucyl aminopeptidase